MKKTIIMYVTTSYARALFDSGNKEDDVYFTLQNSADFLLKETRDGIKYFINPNT